MGARGINQLFVKNVQEQSRHFLRGRVLRRATKRRMLGLITIIDSVNSDEFLPRGLVLQFAFLGFFRTTSVREIISTKPDTLHRISVEITFIHQLYIDIWITESEDALRGITVSAANDHPAQVSSEISRESYRSV